MRRLALTFVALALFAQQAAAEPFDPHLIRRTISGDVLVELAGAPAQDEAIRRRIARMPGVRAAVIAAETRVTASNAGQNAPLILREATPAALAALPFIAGRLTAGRLEVEPAAPGLIIGAELARRLRLRVGDMLTLAAPRQPARKLPVVAIFETEWPNLDLGLAYLSAAAPPRTGTRAVLVYLNDPERLDDVRDAIRAALPKTLAIRDWRQPWQAALQPAPQATIR